jgi:hypothetical protein
MKIAASVVLSGLVVSAAPAFAQGQEPELGLGPGFEQRFDELSEWLREYYAWERWFEQWGNRVARNFNDDVIWERKKRPDPPVWLAAECQGFVGSDGVLASACDILRNWDDRPLRILQRRSPSLVTSAGNVNDKVVKSSFFQRLHLTGLWLRAQYPATPVYGIVGMQIGVIEVRRFTLPAVGVMVMMVPDGEGGHDWKPATTLGFGYRIVDVVLPVINKPASLHFNIARTSIHGVRDERIFQGSLNLNFFGLSVSGRKRR